jgi:pyruvate,water dikinase
MTSLPQLAAEELHVSLASVDVVLGDTDLCPFDMGTFGSMSVRNLGPVLRAAAAEARAVLVQMAAEKLGVTVDDLEEVDGRPVDLEWAHDGATTWWLQARPMTGIDGLRVYSNRIARDVLPGVIKPLVWSVNVPLVNAAWIDVLEELVGPLGVRPEALARSFGYRAYFDMTTIGAVFEALGMPRDSLELLLGLPKGPEAPRFRPGAEAFRHLPRVAGAGRRTLRRGRWARREIDELRRAQATLAAQDPATLDEQALLRRIDAIAGFARRAAYANIVVPLAMHAYDRGLALQLRAAGVDPASVDPAGPPPITIAS